MLKHLLLAFILLISCIPGSFAQTDWDTASGYWNINAQEQLYIPVVVHIVHQYGNEYVPDTAVFKMIKNLNEDYNKRNADTASIIQPYKQYAANAKITFVLASKDPTGQPTTGIVRHFSHLYRLYYGKLEQWPPQKYFNIWISGLTARPIVSALYPTEAMANPSRDGFIMNSQYLSTPRHATHETGHYLNLPDVSGTVIPCGTQCGDDDIFDTPPTRGLFFPGSCPGCPLDDTGCALSYQKTYTYPSPTDSVIVNGILVPKMVTATTDFPDTANTQNFMNNGNCSAMFTKGQVQRMRTALRNPATIRSNLSKHQNLLETGVWLDTLGTLTPHLDLGPLADFRLGSPFIGAHNSGFSSVANRSWRDTITQVEWTISGGQPALSTQFNGMSIRIGQPGWVPITLKTYANVNGSLVSNSITKSNVLYAADTASVSAVGYFQDFNTGAGSDVDQFPIFNYFPSTYGWELVNTAGYLDNTSIRFRNVDPRPTATAANMTLAPNELYADFFTRCFNITGSEFASKAYLTFYSAGAFRVINPDFKNDSLAVSYSTDYGMSWSRLGSLKKDDLGNNGFISSPFYPQSQSEWKLQSFVLPNAAKQNRVYFRFRFYPGTDNAAINYYDWGTGNHFHIDRFHITDNPLGLEEYEHDDAHVTVWPNPTSGSATVSLNKFAGQTAHITVSDMTGKQVFNRNISLAGTSISIDIPKEVLRAKGVYMIRTTNGTTTVVQKLIAY